MDSLHCAAKDLINVIEDDDKLGCDIHLGKADLIANRESLLRSLRAAFGPLAGVGRPAAANLGLHVGGGRTRRSFWKMSIQCGRVKAARLRTKRVLRLRPALHSRVDKLVNAGLAPSILYGCQSYGIDNKDDLFLRRLVAKAHGHGRASGSLSITSAMVDNTSWRGTAGPIVQWAAEVWNAATRPL